MTFATYCEHTSLARPTTHVAISTFSYSISSLYFFLFPRGLQHKRKLNIPCCHKNLYVKANGILVFFLLLHLLIYLLWKLSEEVTKHTHARYNFSSLRIKISLHAKGSYKPRSKIYYDERLGGKDLKPQKMGNRVRKKMDEEKTWKNTGTVIAANK